ncbi:retrovirus-related pol polyprotein from transposon TNT 1-94 [Tanacetum coccineum]
MLIMAENVIAAGPDNRPPMLDKSQYSSWSSRMLLYIKGKEHGKQLSDSVINGPFKYGTVVVLGTPMTPASVRDRTYDDLTEPEKIPKEIWDRVKLLIEGLELSLQERESKLYNEFDTFTSEKGATIHSYYLSVSSAILPSTYYSSIIADSGLVAPSFLPSNDLIASINKAMDFISTTFASRYTPTNNQLRTSSNPRNQATIQDGTWGNRNGGTNTAGQIKVIFCYNYQEEGHMARQCTKTKRPRNSTWFKEKMFLDEALELGEIPTLAIFQTDDLDAFDSNCDEAPSASVVVMAKLSAYDSDVLLEYSEQPPFINDSDIDITNDSNVISYEQYLQETKNEVVQDTNSSIQQDAMIIYVIEKMSNPVAKCNEVNKENKTINELVTTELERYKEHIKFFEERQKVDLTDREKYIDSQMRGVIVDRNAKFAYFQNQIQTLKLQLYAIVESYKPLSTMIDVLKQESKAKEYKYLEEIIDLEKKKKALDIVVYKMGQTMHMLTKPQVFYDESHKTALGYQNPLYLTQVQRKAPALYYGHTIVKQHDSLSVIDEETLILAEETFWLPISQPVSKTLPVQPELVLKEIPRELPTISLVKDIFNKMRSHVNNLDKVITVSLAKEITDMKEVFNQMKTEVAKCSVKRKYFEIEKKELFIENDRLLEYIICQDVVCIAMHADLDTKCVMPANDDNLAYAEME